MRIKSEQTIEEYEKKEWIKRQVKSVIFFLLIVIVFSTFLYFFYKHEVSKEYSDYGNGQILSITPISSGRLGGSYKCEVKLESGELIDAACNSDARWLKNQKILINKTQIAGELLMYSVEDPIISGLTHHSSGTR
jgi:hypothetical protein